jgi:FkbM family methyltransferase
MNDDQTYVQLEDDFGCYIPYPADELFSEIQFVYNEIFTNRSYLSNGIVLPPSPVVVDAGANVGLFSLFVKRERPDARVFAFEPLPPTFDCLRRNLALHGADDVVVRQVALGGKSEEDVQFTFYPKLPANSTRYPENKVRTHEISTSYLSDEMVETSQRLFAKQDFNVKVERLSTLLAEHSDIDRIDLLKVDVEGAELDVLEGIDAQDLARVQQLVVEVQDFDDRLANVLRLLETTGMDLQVEAGEDIPAELKYYTVFGRR